MTPHCSACGAVLPSHPPINCPACGAEHWRNAKPCAGALVMRDGRLLLLRRNTEPWLGWWDIPGGFCDAEEHPMDCAAREAREETGFEVEVTGYLGMWLDRYPGPDDPDHVVTLSAYFHAVAGAAVGAPDPHETAEIGWFAPDDLPEIAFDHARAVLTAWREALSEGRTVTPLPDRTTA
ncbi:MAG TPA: NUDIX hydrolase [Acidimicrobiia bacterium]|nr:NUDIX hydrolase [Acidimicrobiia bacterium]